LVIVVAALELFAWLPLDATTLTQGWSATRSLPLIVVHLLIAGTGILALRASRAARAAAG
jgi:hypothetical protein